MMKNVFTTICFLALLLLAGCFDYDEALELKNDGSGTIQMKFVVEKAYVEQMKQMYKQMAKMMPDAELPANPEDAMFNRGEIEAALAAEDVNAELLAYDISETESKKVWEMKFSFREWRDLYAVYGALSPEDEHDEYTEETEPGQALLTKQDDGTWLFYRSFADVGGDDEYSAEESDYFNEDYVEESEEDYGGYENSDDSLMADQIEEGLEQLTGMVDQMAGEPGEYKIRFSVTFPGKIIESNATSVDANTCVWEYTLDQLQNSRPEQTAVFE